MKEALRLSRAQLRELDRRAVELFGVPSCILMENAGRQAAERILGALRAQSLAGRRGAPPWSVAILCGSGNNAGDGYVVARHLHIAGVRVECFSVCDGARLAGDAALQRRIVEALGIRVESIAHTEELGRARVRWRVDALVDALLGTGAMGPPRPEFAAAIEAFEATQGPLKVALDLPSGMDADTGGAPGACVRAELTVTFAALKLGFDAPGASAFTGVVFLADIGVPPAQVLEQ
ncbi:MAG: NAD(P)H-hydrate epimerase [Planctomycetes bacterium]|nr:NAD(P)H-hydrate epimerase [Planctomycetota bacterium]